MSQKDLIFKWLDDKEAKQWECKELNHVLSLLSKHNCNFVESKGLQNYKTPEAYFFLAKPIDLDVIKEYVDSQENLEYSINSRANVQRVWCKKHFTEIIHEPK